MEHKTLSIVRAEFKADGDGPGEFSGYGATFGNVDQGGDVILKGAFTDALPSFLERGFVPVGHDWLGLPVATIAEAKEDDDGLFFRAEFHSTASAQEARTVMRERIERGKFVGLSIGFLPDYEEGIEFRDDGVRVIKKIAELAEISFVTVPMNREAGVITAKASDGRPVSSLSLLDHAEWVLARNGEFANRAKDKRDARLKIGRVLSQANRSRLSEIIASLQAILDETDPEQDGEKMAALPRWTPRLIDAALMLETPD